METINTQCNTEGLQIAKYYDGSVKKWLLNNNATLFIKK